MSGGIITAGVTGIFKSFWDQADKLFTSDDERAQAALARLRLEFDRFTLERQPQLYAAMAMLEEAKHPSVFVAGWRPFLGWVAGLSLGWELLGRMLVGFLYTTTALLFGGDLEVAKTATEQLPHADTAVAMSLVGLLFGLVGARMLEKIKGVSRERVKPPKITTDDLL